MRGFARLFRSDHTIVFFGAIAALLCAAPCARAADLQWAGRTWKVTSGGMAGVANGSPNNVSVDQNGYLHLKITNNGGTWTAAEIFSTDKLGFGTYQWQVDAPIDRFDKNVVLGLFPYGPDAGIGADGTNEIDIEYSFWGNANGVNGDWTDYPASGKTIGEKSYKFSLNGGTQSTSRFIWSSSSIQNFLLSGFEAVTSVDNLINSWTYAPSNPTTNIPQQALPLGINLWCFDAPPSDGKNVEVVIRDFQFVAEGTNPGMGGAGGTSAGGAAGSGGKSSGGAHSGGGSSGGTSSGGATSGGATSGGASSGGANSGGQGGTGAPSGGTSSGGATSGGASSVAGAAATSGTAGASTGTGGALGTGGAITMSTAGSTSTHAGAGGASTTNGDSGDSSDSGGCTVSASRHTSIAWLFGLALIGLVRRRRSAR